MRSASGNVAQNRSAPPMIMISSAPVRFASRRATSSASSTSWATTAPGAAKALSRVSTILRRPSSTRGSESKVRRPMRMGFPMVTLRKKRMSLDRRQGRPPPLPMARLSPMATTSAMIGSLRIMVRGHDASHGHLGANGGMRIVTDELEILIGEIEQRADLAIDLHAGKRAGRAGQLLVGLVEVIEIE